jgi:hypothetical protein
MAKPKPTKNRSFVGLLVRREDAMGVNQVTAVYRTTETKDGVTITQSEFLPYHPGPEEPFSIFADLYENFRAKCEGTK